MKGLSFLEAKLGLPPENNETKHSQHLRPNTLRNLCTLIVFSSVLTDYTQMHTPKISFKKCIQILHLETRKEIMQQKYVCDILCDVEYSVCRV